MSETIALAALEDAVYGIVWPDDLISLIRAVQAAQVVIAAADANDAEALASALRSLSETLEPFSA